MLTYEPLQGCCASPENRLMPGLFACRPVTVPAQRNACASGQHRKKGQRRGRSRTGRGLSRRPGNVLEIRVGRVEVDVPRSVGYFGGLAAAVGLGLVEPPLALFIAAVPAFKVLTNSAFPRAVRFVGEVL